MCMRCENGKINNFGEEWFSEFPCERKGSASHDKPRIFKTNNMYFMIVENFTSVKIKSCPICGRNFSEKDLSSKGMIKSGDSVVIFDGAEKDLYDGCVFEVLSDPYEVCGEYVVKMKCHETGKYFGGGYAVKYLKKARG